MSGGLVTSLRFNQLDNASRPSDNYISDHEEMDPSLRVSVGDFPEIIQDNETNESTYGFTIRDDLFPDYPSELTQLTAVVCVLFFLLGIPGNLITIVALARCKKVRSIYPDSCIIFTKLTPDTFLPAGWLVQFYVSRRHTFITSKANNSIDCKCLKYTIILWGCAFLKCPQFSARQFCFSLLDNSSCVMCNIMIVPLVMI